MPLMPFDPAVSRIRSMLEAMTRTNAMGYGMDMPEQEGIAGNQIMQPEPAIASMPPYMGAPTQNPEMSSPEMLGVPPEIDYHQRMLKLYKPEHSASDRLEAIIGRLPERNKPGLMRKIAATIGGMGGGIRTADTLMYAPYYNALDDWKTEYEPTKDLAKEERYSNNNARMLANSMLTQEMSDKRLQATIARHGVLGKNSDRRMDQGDRKIDQGDRRIDLAEKGFQLKEKLANGGQIVKTDDGKVYLMNRMGELEELPLNNLSFEEKEIVKANQSIRAAKEKPVRTGAGQRDRLQLKVNADGSHTVINLDKEVATSVKTKEGAESKAPTTELDKNRKLTANAMKVKNENAAWNKFIKFDKSGRFTGITTPGVFSGPSKEVYNQIYQRIYGSPSKTVFDSAKDAETKKAGKVRVKRKSDGATGTMDASDPKLKSGEYEVIQ